MQKNVKTLTSKLRPSDIKDASVIIHTDGGIFNTETHKNVMSYGWYLNYSYRNKSKNKKSRRIFNDYGISGVNGTSNQSELLCILRAVEFCAKSGMKKVLIYSDSELSVNTITGKYKAKKPELKKLIKQIKSWSKTIPEFDIQWCPRKDNSQADALCWQARHRFEISQSEETSHRYG
jgi:ribonuclease HI